VFELRFAARNQNQASSLLTQEQRGFAADAAGRSRNDDDSSRDRLTHPWNYTRRIVVDGEGWLRNRNARAQSPRLRGEEIGSD